MRYFPLITFVLLFTACLTDEQQEELTSAADSPAVQESEVDTFIVGGNGTIASIETPEGESLRLENDTAIDNIRAEIGGSNVPEDRMGADLTIVRNPDIGPSFPGGSMAMDKYIAEELVYPLVAFQNDIKGTVNVRFVVETDGRISGITVQNGLGYGCDEAAIDLIRSMPRWTPGKKGGVNVRCSVTLPITFPAKEVY